MMMRTDGLNRLEIAQNVSKKTGVKLKDTLIIINTFLEEIKEQFQSGNMIEFRGFGTFYPYLKRPREYVIPRLKERRNAKGYLTLKFKPSKQILIYSTKPVKNAKCRES